MIEHVFPPEMMREREKQLMMALLDCAGVIYDINLTQDRILGWPIQVVNGVAYPILEQIGKPKNCTYTEIIDYWAARMAPEEVEGFVTFSRPENICARYAAGERRIMHRFWTHDIMGNPMLAEQSIRLYEDCTSGDLLGLVYVSNGEAQDALLKKETQLAEQNQSLYSKVLLWESVGVNIPGGYHRCSTDDGFRLQFVSDSFLEIVGWTREELENELDNQFLQIVAPEDRAFFMSHEEPLVRNGRIDLAYRILRKDGTRRWVQDATIRMAQDGTEFYQCTLADITAYVESLNEEKRRAEASSQAKSTFLFNASHDIRTPMNAIQGFAHIIEQHADDAELVKETVQKIIQSSNTLMSLLNDVLELSRIEQGKSELSLQATDLHQHSRNLYEMFMAEMEQSKINFRLDSDIQHKNVMCDPLKMTRIGMNLLSNARKFTHEGGSVTFGIGELTADENTATYRFYVRDTGIGMSREFQQRAFEQFERERSSTVSGVSGSGLGLAIIKNLVDLMGGTCAIESELGKGTEISVRLTFELAHEVQLAGHDGTAKAEDIGNKRVLLVEDNDFNREIARYVLEDAGIEVEEAEDGVVAVNKLLTAEPGYYDLVLMDIQMPVMDGYTATQEIRRIANPRISSVPIVAMTANAFKEDVEKCRAVGMNGHLSKPIDVKLLMQEIARHCR